MGFNKYMNWSTTTISTMFLDQVYMALYFQSALIVVHTFHSISLETAMSYLLHLEGKIDQFRPTLVLHGGNWYPAIIGYKPAAVLFCFRGCGRKYGLQFKSTFVLLKYTVH